MAIVVARPEAVIFDFDGVIVDTEPLHYQAFLRTLEPLGLRFTWQEYVDAYMGFDDRDAFTAVFRARGVELDDRKRTELVAAKGKVFREVIRDGVNPYPGAMEMITALHASGLPLAICSGALRSDIDPIVAGLGIAKCFREIVTADEVLKSKPDPECYTLAFMRLARACPSRLTVPRDSLAVEDTPAGVRAAKRAGLTVLAVTNTHAGPELAEADHIADSLGNVRFGG